MTEFIINPLTTEERLQVVRLIRHDSRNNMNNLLGFTAYLSSELDIKDIDGSNLQAAYADAINVSQIMHAMSDLIQEEELYFCDQDYYYGNNVKILFEGIRLIYPKSKGEEIIRCEKFRTKDSLIHLVMSNFVKNSLCSGSANIDLIAEDVSVFPDAVYVPEGARAYGNFVALRVHDNGQGFTNDKPLIDRLTVCPEKGKHGFGLYFTGLVAKVLRAPVDIQSKPGDTTVSFYQPIYDSE